MNLIPVEGERNLARDLRTNAIINTNEKQRIENLENQISEVKDDLNEIKMLLRRLSNGS
jgi:predicted transcriptional regulator